MQGWKHSAFAAVHGGRGPLPWSPWSAVKEHQDPVAHLEAGSRARCPTMPPGIEGRGLSARDRPVSPSAPLLFPGFAPEFQRTLLGTTTDHCHSSGEPPHAVQRGSRASAWPVWPGPGTGSPSASQDRHAQPGADFQQAPSWPGWPSPCVSSRV